jgi:hypothetical protein
VRRWFSASIRGPRLPKLFASCGSSLNCGGKRRADMVDDDSDYLTQDGAVRLARMIKAVWRADGHVVTCRVVPLAADIRPDDDASARAAIYRNWAVRSDLVDGLPACSQSFSGPHAGAVSVPPLPEARPRFQRLGRAPESAALSSTARPRLRRPGVLESVFRRPSCGG